MHPEILKILGEELRDHKTIQLRLQSRLSKYPGRDLEILNAEIAGKIHSLRLAISVVERDCQLPFSNVGAV